MAKKCLSRKRDGKKCGVDAQSGKNICVFHDLSRAADGQRARRKGGMNRNRPATALSPETPDNPLRSSLDVSELLGGSINAVRKGQLDPRLANAVGYFASGLLRALEQGPVQERLARIEASLGLETETQAGSTREGVTRRVIPNDNATN